LVLRFSDPIRLVRIGEQDGWLASAAKTAATDSIQRIWTVNQIPLDRIAGPNLLHHPGKSESGQVKS